MHTHTTLFTGMPSGKPEVVTAGASGSPETAAGTAAAGEKSSIETMESSTKTIMANSGMSFDAGITDNEGNTPLHLAAEAGHADVLSNLLAFFRDVQIDSRNHGGLTPLMKAAIQGRTNCAKILLFAGACPALRDAGRVLCATEWARLCGRHATADIIERFPHTSCLLHPSVHTNHSGTGMPSDRSLAAAAQRLAHSAGGTIPPTCVFPVRPATSHNGHASGGGSSAQAQHDSPRGLTVRRAYRASSEPNLQARPSVQLQLEQLQELNGGSPSHRRKPSWIKKRLKQALGMDKHHRKSLQPGQMTSRFGSTPSLMDGTMANHHHSSMPFSCVGHRNASRTNSDSGPHGKRAPPMIVPKVKIQHTDSQQDIISAAAAASAAATGGNGQQQPPQNPEKRHKLDFKRVIMFRKRSSTITATESSKKI